MNFISTINRKAFGSIAAICLFSAATCAVLTLPTAAKQGDNSFASFSLKSTESSSYLLLIDSEKKNTIKNNSNTVLTTNKTGKNNSYQTGKSLADLSDRYVYASIVRPLTIFFMNRVWQLQDNGLISIRKIE